MQIRRDATSHGELCGQKIFWARAMGWVKPRAANDGSMRYTGMYRDLRGRERSAGTFASKRAAERAAQRAEAAIAAGRVADPRRGRQLLRD
ncbi:MAG TPA: hypothetical protein VI248_08955 [Kineosporiaceae bacterium]